jgi:hypothetical protein
MRIKSTSSRPRPSRRSTAARLTPLALCLAGAVMTLTTACTLQDNICSDGEYPVASIGSSSGGACVRDGDDPPKGYVGYPKGQVPKHVDDKWDKYWQEHTLDAHGNPG